MEKKPQESVSREADKYIVRFPDGMRDRIAAAAKANNRSMNAEIVARLDASFDISKAGPEGPVDFSRLITELTERQNAAALKTELALAEMRADNAAIATRGLKVEIRELREVIEEAANASAPSHQIDELRGRLRLAEAVLPQHLDIIANARRKVDELRRQIEASALNVSSDVQAPKPPTAEDMRRELKEEEERMRAYEREEAAEAAAAAKHLRRPAKSKKGAK